MPDDGFTDDTFLHLFDAWCFDAMEASSEQAVDEAVKSLDVFTNEMGDRFEDPKALADALDDWTTRHGADGRPKTRAIVAELLEMWRRFDAVAERA